MQVREPTAAISYFLGFEVEITKDGQYSRALFKRQPNFFTQRCNLARCAFVVFGNFMKFPYDFRTALPIRTSEVRRQQVLDAVVEDLQRVGFLFVNVSQTRLVQDQLPTAFLNLFPSVFYVVFASR